MIYTNNLTQNIFENNPVWVQLLGLCPLLAVSTTLGNSIGLALATCFVLISSNLLISALRAHIPNFIRLPCFVLIISTFTTIAVLFLEAFAFNLYLQIALFLQIIVTNCAILERAESFASKNAIVPSFLDALGTSIGFAAAIIALGTVREILGQGSLFEGLNLLFGDYNLLPKIIFFDKPPISLASLPPGAFLVAGLLLALAKFILGEDAQTHEPAPTKPVN